MRAFCFREEGTSKLREPRWRRRELRGRLWSQRRLRGHPEQLSSQTEPKREDKFIVRSNITSNKLQDFETVSRGSRHRSNHTQKNIPSVVAGHQFLQFVALARTTEYFLSLVIHPGFCLKTDHKIHFHRTAFSGPAACLW